MIKPFKTLKSSVRAKIMLIVVIWAGLMLSSWVVNGILSAQNTGDAELLNQVAILRMLPQRMSHMAISIVYDDEDPANYESLRMAMHGYAQTLGSLEPERTDPLERHIPQPILFPGNFVKEMLFKQKLEEARIEEAVKRLREEWINRRSIFISVLEKDRNIDVTDISMAADDLVFQSDELATTIQSIINEKLIMINKVNLAVILGGILLAVIVYMSLNSVIVKPIVRLREAAERFARGERDARAEIFSREDEVGELALSFNSMAETVAERESIDRERMKEIANMNEELLVASQMKTQFLATISHELRTPMNSIIGYSEVLLDGLDGELNDEQTEDVRAVLRSAENLLKLINDILDLSKIEAGRMKVDLSSVRLRDVVKEAAHSIEPLVKESGLTHEIVFIDENVTVRADRDRLEQILLNLYSNAVKFTKDGGFRTRIMKDDRYGIIAVEDTGIGIPPDQVNHIFQEFHQIDGATTREYGGTGLGLAIVKQFIELMEGNISVTSRLGEGSTFRVRLPLDRPAASDTEESAPTVLLVDDDPETVSLYTRYLQKDGYRILTSATVSEAKTLLEKLPSGSVAAALLDVKLPDDDGYDLLRFIRNHPNWSALATGIVSITDDRARSRAMGADGHLVKPAGRQELVNFVRTIMSRESRGGGE